jgi:hypothetical protein
MWLQCLWPGQYQEVVIHSDDDSNGSRRFADQLVRPKKIEHIFARHNFAATAIAAI